MVARDSFAISFQRAIHIAKQFLDGFYSIVWQFSSLRYEMLAVINLWIVEAFSVNPLRHPVGPVFVAVATKVSRKIIVPVRPRMKLFLPDVHLCSKWPNSIASFVYFSRSEMSHLSHPKFEYSPWHGYLDRFERFLPNKMDWLSYHASQMWV